MAITPIQDFVSSVLARTHAQPPALNSSAPTVASTAPASGESAVVSVISAAAQSTSLYNASVSVAQLSSFLEVAQAGTEGVASILQNLQSLAQQAASAVPNASLTEIDSEFQQVLSGIDQAVQGTTFGGSTLLDGTFSAPQGTTSSALSLPDLSSATLFGSTPPSLLTPSGGNNALGLVNSALNTIGTVNTAITQAQNQASFAAASLESAQANATASVSYLTEADLVNGAAGLSGLLASPAASSRAQSSNLSPALLSLVQE